MLLFAVASRLGWPVHVVEQWPYSEICEWSHFFNYADGKEPEPDPEQKLKNYMKTIRG